MTPFSVLTALLLVLNTVAAQQELIPVCSRVSSKEGEPLSGTNIVVKETGRGASTDDKGWYTLRNLPPGTYDVKFSFIGYEKVTRNVVIRTGQTLSLDITLESTVFKIGEMQAVAERPLVSPWLSSQLAFTLDNSELVRQRFPAVAVLYPFGLPIPT